MKHLIRKIIKAEKLDYSYAKKITNENRTMHLSRYPSFVKNQVNRLHGFLKGFVHQGDDGFIEDGHLSWLKE